MNKGEGVQGIEYPYIGTRFLVELVLWPKLCYFKYV